MSVIALEAERKPTLTVSIWSILVVAGVVVLFFGQVLTGTPMGFAMLVSTFILIGSAATKVMGGIFTLPGLSITVLMCQHVVISQASKVWYLQPADDRLLMPYQTMVVYNLTALGILCAALLYRTLRVDRIKPIFDLEFDTRRLAFISVVFTILAVGRLVLLQVFGVFEGVGGGVYVGGFVGPLRQFGFITSLATAAGTAHVILSSKGKRCVGLWNSLAIVSMVGYGILGAGRQDSVSAVVAFVLTLIAFRFKMRLWHWVFAALSTYVFFAILFPYALYARGEGTVREGSLEMRISKAASVLGDVAINPGKYKAKESTIAPGLPWSMQRLFYFGKKIPTLDRYAVINATDNIVNAVEQRGANGPETAFAGFLMILPRFLNPGKEALGTANQIAHYGDGLVGEGDFYTQITLGMAADSYFCFKYAGAFFIPFIVSLAYFTVYRIMFRPHLRNNIYIAGMLFLSTWVFSEGTIQGQTLNIIQNPFYYFVAVFPVMFVAKSLTKRVKEAPFVYETSSATSSETPALGAMADVPAGGAGR